MRDAKIFLLIFAISFLAMYFVPSTNFPLNDEWVYFRSIQNFFETGAISCEGCTTSGILLISFGAVLTKLFGFSFALLRDLTIVLGSLSVAVSYLILKEVTKKWKLSLLASLFLLANPIFYNLSHLFMTDVPFLFFLLLSIYFAVKGIENKDPKYFIFSAIVSIAAVLLRQLAIAVPVGILFYILLANRRMLKNIPAMISVVLPLVVLGLFVLNQIQTTGKYYSQEFDVRNPVGISKEGVYYAWSTLIYLGFFFMPLAFLFYKYLRDKTFLASILIFSAIAIGAALLLSNSFPQTSSMPYLGNMMNKNGVGAISIPGQEGKENYFPEGFWMFATAASILSASVIATELVSRIRKRNFRSTEMFLIIIVAMFLTMTITKVGGFFDRYLIVYIPLLAFIVVGKMQESRTLVWISAAFVALMLAFSLVGMFDYIKWNEVRWDQISQLQSQGVSKESINGGFEFCLYNFGMKYQYDYWKKIGVYDSPGIRPHDWKFCPGDDYVISFSERPSYLVSERTYAVDKKVDYCLSGNFLCDQIFVLKAG